MVTTTTTTTSEVESNKPKSWLDTIEGSTAFLRALIYNRPVGNNKFNQMIGVHLALKESSSSNNHLIKRRTRTGTGGDGIEGEEGEGEEEEVEEELSYHNLPEEDLWRKYKELYDMEGVEEEEEEEEETFKDVEEVSNSIHFSSPTLRFY